MGKISYTFALMRSSWELLKQDKELLVFPLLSGICCLAVLASFAIPMWQGERFAPPAADASTSQQVSYYATLFLFYWCNYFIITFFNSAVVACAVMRLQGKDPTVGDGLRAAGARLPLIAGWALVAATVGLLLRMIEDRSQKVGRFVAGLLGMAWSVMTFLVVPIMVVDRKGPVEALKQSTRLVRKTWGEQLVSRFSFGLIFLLLALPAFLLFVIGFMAGTMTAIVVFIALGVVYLVALSLVESVLLSIFQAALYLYVRDAQTAPEFGGLLADAMGSS